MARMTIQPIKNNQSLTDHNRSIWSHITELPLDLRIPQQRRERYRQVKRSGLNGALVGAKNILEAVIGEAKEQGLTESEINTFESEVTVRREITHTPFAGDDAPYEYGKSQLPDELKSYVHRLEILKEAMFNGEKLTNREARMAKRTLTEFQDPQGERVDLIAQYAVLWELVERTATGKEISDIEDLFAFAPWTSSEASKLYRLAVEKGLLKSFTILRLIAPLLTPGSGNAHVPELFIGAHAQLNLPYIWSWIQEHQDKNRDFNVTYRDDSHFKEHNEHITDAVALRASCNWREFIKAKLNGAATETVTLSIGRDEQENSND